MKFKEILNEMKIIENKKFKNHPEKIDPMIKEKSDIYDIEDNNDKYICIVNHKTSLYILDKNEYFKIGEFKNMDDAIKYIKE